jgi:hypothetical protein
MTGNLENFWKLILALGNWPAGKGSLNKHSFISGVLYLYRELFTYVPL